MRQSKFFMQIEFKILILEKVRVSHRTSISKSQTTVRNRFNQSKMAARWRLLYYTFAKGQSAKLAKLLRLKLFRNRKT